MDYRKLTMLLALLLFSGMAFAAAPGVTVLNNDGNYYYPSGGTVTIQFNLTDGDSPGDANVGVYYSYQTDPTTKLAIVDVNGENGVDSNSMQFCSLPLTATEQVCTYTWTLPSGLDSNFLFDVNVMDITTGDDANASSTGSFYIDTNACTTAHTIGTNDTVTLTTTCSGYGLSSTKYFNYNRVQKCGTSYSTYSAPFRLTLGSFNVCYYSTDSLGNTESTKGFMHTSSSNTVNLLGLSQVALAGLILVAIAVAGLMAYSGEGDSKTVVLLGGTAIVIVIAILVMSSII